MNTEYGCSFVVNHVITTQGKWASIYDQELIKRPQA